MAACEDWRTRSAAVIEKEECRSKCRQGRTMECNVRRRILPKGTAGTRYPRCCRCRPMAPRSSIWPPVGRESDYTRGTGGIESGMTDYFVPRGYVHVHGDPRGIGRSGGKYLHFGEQEQQDGHDLIEWIARQPWCNGNVGMLGMSYFAVNQLLVATQRPPSLKAIFVHDGYTDMYRQLAYHGGIFNFGFYQHIWRLFPHRLRNRWRDAPNDGRSTKPPRKIRRIAIYGVSRISTSSTTIRKPPRSWIADAPVRRGLLP